MTQTETRKNTPSPSIAHWLKHRGAQTTVRWITKEGEQHELRGMVTGYGVTPSGVQKLIVKERYYEPGNRVPQSRQHTIPSGALRRYLDSVGQTPQTKVYSREDYCGGCGKLLGTGRIGFLDESVVPGLCFNCA